MGGAPPVPQTPANILLWVCFLSAHHNQTVAVAATSVKPRRPKLAVIPNGCGGIPALVSGWSQISSPQRTRTRGGPISSSYPGQEDAPLFFHWGVRGEEPSRSSPLVPRSGTLVGGVFGFCCSASLYCPEPSSDPERNTAMNHSGALLTHTFGRLRWEIRQMWS